MPSRSEFLREMLANADDHGPRLIFADWLEENGTTDAEIAYAEYLRINQQLDAGEGDARKLKTRKLYLLSRHSGEWHTMWVEAAQRGRPCLTSR